jgi:nicotinamide-nucleotide adenylyltransferase
MTGDALAGLERIGTVARWKPVHLGHAPVLRALCDRARHALIGVGSSNRYNLRNPFTAKETAEMIRAVLAGRTNFDIVPVPDLDDGPRWRDLVSGLFGDLDLFFTDNPYVTRLLSGTYRVIRPVGLVPDAERIPMEGTSVRMEMARGDRWRNMVPPEVRNYVLERGLDVRFRREFGLQTLSTAADLEDARLAGGPAGPQIRT